MLRPAMSSRPTPGAVFVLCRIARRRPRLLAPNHRESPVMDRATKTPQPPTEAPMELDQEAINRARSDIDDGAVTPSAGPWVKQIIGFLNDSLATELVCVMRYRRHYFTASGLASPAIADEFLEHANDELGHADRIAERIVQLGGEPDFRPSGLEKRSHAEYDDSKDIRAMLRANLVAERVAVETYRQLIRLIGDKDPTTRRLLEDVLADEEQHADELKDMLNR